MRPATKPLLWAGGLVAAGVLLVLLLRGGAEDTASTGTVPPTDSVATATPAPVVAAPSADAGQTPPWLSGSPGNGTAAAATAARPSPYFGGRQPTQAELDQALVQIREKTLQNDRAAEELLRQLDTLQATGKLPPDLNAEALRTNLLVAKRSQNLARELAELVNAPANDATRKRMDAIVSELQQLQKQLRYDVHQTGAPAAAVLPPNDRTM